MRYEIRTLPIGQDIAAEIDVIEVLNIRPEANQFRALVEVFPEPAYRTFRDLVAEDAVLEEE